MSTTDNELQYPIGKSVDQRFSNQSPYSEEAKEALLADIKTLPSLLEYSIQNLDEAQLKTPYRPGGWTPQQVVHHVADSHMNAYTRFKLGLTEENPTIKPYDQDAWATLCDNNLPVNISLTLLHALHARLYEMMRNMSEAEWQRTIYHPEQQRDVSLWSLLALYAWHGKHHAAQISSLKKRMKW